MVEFSLAIDEYLHAIVRNRPWTVSRETELLEALSDWLYEQPDQSVELESVTTAVTRQFANDTYLSDAEHEELDAALVRLNRWIETYEVREIRLEVEQAARASLSQLTAAQTEHATASSS